MSRYTLSDALAIATWLNVFVRQSKYVGMANMAQSVNVISPLMTTQTGLVKQTTWWPLYLFSKYMRGVTIAVNVCCGFYDGETEPSWIKNSLDTAWLDVSAVRQSDGTICLVVVNIHESLDFGTELLGVCAKTVKAFSLTGPNVQATNTESSSEVTIQESEWNGQGDFVFRRHSMTLLMWKPVDQRP